MSDVLVIGAACTADRDKWKYLRESAAFHSVNLHVFGRPSGLAPHEIAGETLPEGIAILKSRPEPYVVVTDTFDVMITRWDEQEVVRRIEAIQSTGIILSTESNCYPKGPWCSRYIKSTPWCYPNGGQFCGRRDAVIDLLQVMQSRLEEATLGGSNQEILHMMLAEGILLRLDTYCHIFQSMYGEESRFITLDSGGLWNDFTGSKPMFLHFNGRTPGLKEWYESIYPSNSPQHR